MGRAADDQPVAAASTHSTGRWSQRGSISLLIRVAIMRLEKCLEVINYKVKGYIDLKIWRKLKEARFASESMAAVGRHAHNTKCHSL